MADKKLSLPTRKNLRDNEDKKKEHLARIEAASGKSGVEFTIKNDIAVAEQLASNGYADRIGEIFYDSYLSYLADALTKLCSSEDNKAALGGSWTSNNIYFETDEKAENYQQITFEGGDIRMACKKSNIWSNISYLGGDIEGRLSSPFAGEVLPLKSASDLRANIEKKDECLGAIATATGKSGLEFAFKDIKGVDAQLKKNGYENRIGEVFYANYLQYLSEALTKLCADDLAKVAINQKWTSNKIFFELDAKAPTYQNVNFPGGDLRLSCKPENIWSNLSYLGGDIPDQLTSEFNGVVLSLKTVQNIKEYEEKAQVHLGAIGTALGRSGPVTFVVEDIKSVDENLNKNGYNNRVGEVIWEAYLQQISSKLTSLCGDEMVKEAIGDSFKNNLVFKLDPKCEGYQNCKFADGNLVMFCKPSNIWSNLSYLGEDIEKQL
jgi:hypothetical protein